MWKKLAAILSLCTLLLWSIPAPALADDSPSLFLDFSSGQASDLIYQTDLSGYGISPASLSITGAKGDQGNALRVDLDWVSNRTCQALSYTSSVASAFADAAGYLRVWIVNPNTAALDVAVNLTAPGKSGYCSGTGAQLYRCDGQAASVAITNATGGGSFSVVVPGGFAGWISWPVSQALVSAWGSTVPAWTEVTNFKLDIRPESAGTSHYYVLDDFGFSADGYGTLRDHPLPADLFCTFTSGQPADLIYQTDLSGYGISPASLSITGAKGDQGNALRVELDGVSNRTCQALSCTSSVAGAFADAAGYLRVWVVNPNTAALAIAANLTAPGKSGYCSGTGAQLYRCDGQQVSVTITNATGGGNFSVLVPGGFAGWLAWPVSQALVSAWGSTVPSWTEVTGFKLDIRPQSAGTSHYYILDDFGFSHVGYGALRAYPLSADLFCTFSSGQVSDWVSQADLSAYGVTAAPMSLTASNGDQGNSLRLDLDWTSTRYCQSLLYASSVAGAFADAAGYLRMWVYNPNSAALAVAVNLTAPGKSGYCSGTGAQLFRCDGQQLGVSTTNATGGGNFSVLVPGGFTGWLSWPVSEALVSAWGSTVPSWTEVTGFKLDIRPLSAGGSQYYVIDDIGFSLAGFGSLRNYESPLPAFYADKKDLLNDQIAQYLSITPAITWLPAYDPDSDPNSSANEWSNIKAFTYEGATINGQKTKIFAYIGYPAGTGTAPAIVLVHGGGGHAFAEWIKRWTDRGYVAIATDNTGYFPSPAGKGKAGRESDYLQDPPYWQYGLYGDFSQTGFVNAPNNDNMYSSDNAIDTMWMYHAVTGTILAQNMLRADARVDDANIGIMGISWGGDITSQTIGYDSRFAFAMPVYGSAYLDESLGWQAPLFVGSTQALWSAEDRLDQSSFPILWLGWTLDLPFSIQGQSLSYNATSDHALMSMLMNMGHSHSAGWNAAEPYRFADSVAKGTPGLAVPVTVPTGQRNISFSFTKPTDATAVSARIWYINSPMTYSTNGPEQTFYWQACTVTGTTVTGTVPYWAYSYYVEITITAGGVNYVTSTPFVNAQ